MRAPFAWTVDWNEDSWMVGKSILEQLKSARQVKMGEGEKEEGAQSLKTGSFDLPIMYRYMCDAVVKVTVCINKPFLFSALADQLFACFRLSLMYFGCDQGNLLILTCSFCSSNSIFLIVPNGYISSDGKTKA